MHFSEPLEISWRLTFDLLQSDIWQMIPCWVLISIFLITDDTGHWPCSLFFLWLDCAACRIVVPLPGIEPVPHCGREFPGYVLLLIFL